MIEVRMVDQSMSGIKSQLSGKNAERELPLYYRTHGEF
jgi:hypothetical protein